MTIVYAAKRLEELSIVNRFLMDPDWCHTCRGLTLRCPLPLEPHFFHEHGPDGDRLSVSRHAVEVELSAAMTGCHYCSLLYRTMLFHGGASENVTINMRQIGGTDLLFDGRTTVQLFCPPGMPRAWDGVLVSEDLSGDPGSDDALRCIKRWHAICDQTHRRCRRETPSLPKRLLAIGEEAETSHIYLWEPGRGSVGQYAALSYCWGGDEGIRTTEANLVDMKAGIAVRDMPRTMRDAMDIARKLRIHHIWIDALCIVQDSRLDWEVESSCMASIYQNAYLTIAADASPAASEGIFGRRMESRVQATSWTNQQGLQTVVKSRVVDRAEHVASTARAPLKSRAWALQEDVLSHRLLTFGLGELGWRCGEAQTCECQLRQRTPVSLPAISSLKTSSDAFSAWLKYARAYSRRSLTVTQDRLSALSGIASVVQSKTQWKYVAGIWLENCYEDLAWQVSSTPPVPCDAFAPADGSLPTFSWLSVVDRTRICEGYKPEIIHHNDWETESILEVMPYAWNARPTGQDPFGPVADAWISLRGHLVPAVLKTTQRVSATGLLWHDPQTVYVLQFAGRQDEFRPDVIIEETTLSSNAADGPSTTARRAHPPSEAKDDFIQYFSRVDVPVMLLTLSRHFTSDQNGRGYRICLVLARSARHPRCFERLGMHKVPYERPGEWPGVSDSSRWTTITLV